MELLIPKKNVILDSQVLSTLMGCPRLDDFRFNLNLMSMGGKSKSLEMGSLVHVIMEYFYNGIINKLKREQAIQFAFAAGETYITGCSECIAGDCQFHKTDKFLGLQNTPIEDSQYAIDTCQQYFDFRANDHWIPLEVEVVKGKILYEDDEVRILWKSKFDLMTDTNQGILPVDHKTMKQRRDTVSLNNQFIGQCLIAGTRNVIINKIGFQTSLKPEEKFTRAVISYSADRLLEWQSETLPYYAKLLLMYQESGHFPPNFTHCESKFGKCQFIHVCEADRGMREEEIRNSFVMGEKWDPGNIEGED